MTQERLRTYLDEMEQASEEVVAFLGHMTWDDFLLDVVKQRAVGMNLLIIGEASTQLAERYPEFAADHPEIPWVGIRGMRNRIAHGYLRMNLQGVWETSKTAIPELLDCLQALKHWRAQGE